MAIAVVVVAVPFSTLMFSVLAKGPITRFDSRTANVLNDWVHTHPGVVSTLRAVSFMGKPIFLAVVIAFGVAYVLVNHRPRLAVFLIVTSLGGGVVDSLVKLAVNRPRPVVDHPVATALGKSFPSGHAMSSTVCYFAILLVFQAAVPRRARVFTTVVTVLVVLAVGTSRLLLGVHFVSDVIGGYLLGAAWLIGAVAAFETWRVDEGKPESHPLTEGVEPEASADLSP